MTKKLIALVIVATFLIIGLFVVLNRSGHCDGIFEQAAPQLKVKLQLLKTNGEWVIGKEKLQQIADNSQKVALHLKTCCILRDGNSISAEQFQVCVNGAKEYDAKIGQITDIVAEAQAAKAAGNTQLADQKIASAQTAAGETDGIVRKVADATKDGKPQLLPPDGKQVFFNDFRGAKTLEDWEVLRPLPDLYALEKDGLLIISSSAGNLGSDNIPNLFKLKKDMPPGDWTATMSFSSEFPLANEAFYLGLFQDKDDWTAAKFQSFDSAAGPYLFFRLIRKSASEAVEFRGNLIRGTGEYHSFIAENKLNQPIDLRLQRSGHDFLVSSRLESADPAAWVTLTKITALHSSGSLVFGFVKEDPYGGGQSQAKIHWVRIEAP